ILAARASLLTSTYNLYMAMSRSMAMIGAPGRAFSAGAAYMCSAAQAVTHVLSAARGRDASGGLPYYQETAAGKVLNVMAGFSTPIIEIVDGVSVRFLDARPYCRCDSKSRFIGINSRAE